MDNATLSSMQKMLELAKTEENAMNVIRETIKRSADRAPLNVLLVLGQCRCYQTSNASLGGKVA
jgi:hypothetical protein